ncbi:MAG TPA: peroxidase-related enzyme [Thermoanaerobaculia bacterium]|jgi:uncharacterized peroxidase-related enzyme
MSYLERAPLDEDAFPPFRQIRETFGFLPNFFRAQTLRADLVEPQMNFIGSIMVGEGALARRQKEYIFLVTSAANLSTYCVTAHCEIVRMLGIEGPEPELVAINHNATDIPVADKALLNFALKLNATPKKIEADDIDALRTYDFTDQQILEAILMVGISQYATVVSFGLGTVPDFDSARVEMVLGVPSPALSGTRGS